MIEFLLGVFLGLGMFTTKACLFWLATGGENQYRFRKWIILGPRMPIRDRIESSAFLTVCVDSLGGYVGTHTLAIFGATNLALIAFCIYTMACMFTLMRTHITHKWKRWLNSFSTPKQPIKSWR